MKKFETPVVEVQMIFAEDVIATSNCPNEMPEEEI